MSNSHPGLGLRGRRTELAALDRLLAEARAGQSRVLVLRGDAGVGKTALLGYLQEQASGFRVARAVGVESEMELAFAGLHQEVVPSSVELRWRPRDHHAALWSSFWLAALTFWKCASSAARSFGRCRWPLTRRNWRPASIMPAAHQRSAMVPSRHRLTFLLCSRQIPIIDSMLFVECSVCARVGGTPSRRMVRVSAMPSRSDAAAPGWVFPSSAASSVSRPSACNADSAW